MHVFWGLSIHLYLIGIKHSWCSPLLRCFKKCHRFSLMRTEAHLAQWSISVTAVFKCLLGQTQFASQWRWEDLGRKKAARLGLHIGKVQVRDGAGGRRSGEQQLPYADPFLPASSRVRAVDSRGEGAKKFPSVASGVLLKLNQEDFWFNCSVLNRRRLVAACRREALVDHTDPGLKFVTKNVIMLFTETGPYCHHCVDKVFWGIDCHFPVRLERGDTKLRPLPYPLVYWLCYASVSYYHHKKQKK